MALPILSSVVPEDVVLIDEIGRDSTKTNWHIDVIFFKICSGKMELFSRKFIDATASLFERGADVRVVCTIPSKSSHAFVRSLRERADKELVEVDGDNRDRIPKTVIDLLYPDFKPT